MAMDDEEMDAFIPDDYFFFAIFAFRGSSDGGSDGFTA